MAADLHLAIAHHLLVFALAAILAVEAALVRPGLGGKTLSRLTRYDSVYGGVSVLVILVGIGRVLWGLKGWEYYVTYWVFWAKMAAFVLVGLLSIAPTIRFIRWRKAAADNPAYVVPDAEIAAAKKFLVAEMIVFALIPIFAAMMARGVGY